MVGSQRKRRWEKSCCCCADAGFKARASHSTERGQVPKKKGMRFIDIGTIKYYACLSIVGINFIYDTTKDKGFTNEYATQDLTFSKTVTGNQGSREKYFQFTVKISNAVAGTKYDVDLTNAVASAPENLATKTEYDGKTNHKPPV